MSWRISGSGGLACKSLLSGEGQADNRHLEGRAVFHPIRQAAGSRTSSTWRVMVLIN